ncbi:DUF3022 domain-containing protein [Burkholderia stagnalis]
MQSNSRTRFEHGRTDSDAPDAPDASDADTTVRLDASGRITFHAAWAAADASTAAARHAVVLELDVDTMERYADLDEPARRRVHAMLHEAAQDMLDRLPDDDDDRPLIVELTGAMLDAARHLQ